MTHSISPAEWRDLDGWKEQAGDAVAFLDALIATMNEAADGEGFELHWHIFDTHRSLHIEPYIMLGARRRDAAAKSILCAFGFAYAKSRTWPKEFHAHYAQRICEHYALFENGLTLPIGRVSDTELEQFLADTGLKLQVFTLPQGFGRAVPQDKQVYDPSPSAAPGIDRASDPFDAMEHDGIVEASSDPFDAMELPGVFD